MSDDKRKDRELESRDSALRDEPWVPAARLPIPNVPPGMTARWVRSRVGNENDDMNVSKALREGWVPVKISDHPEMQIIPDLNSRFEGNVEVGGMLLCFRDKKTSMKENEYVRGVTDGQMKAVDHNFMKENDARMPLLKPERQTSTNKFGTGS